MEHPSELAPGASSAEIRYELDTVKLLLQTLSPSEHNRQQRSVYDRQIHNYRKLLRDAMAREGAPYASPATEQIGSPYNAAHPQTPNTHLGSGSFWPANNDLGQVSNTLSGPFSQYASGNAFEPQPQMQQPNYIVGGADSSSTQSSPGFETPPSAFAQSHTLPMRSSIKRPRRDSTLHLGGELREVKSRRTTPSPGDGGFAPPMFPSNNRYDSPGYHTYGYDFVDLTAGFV
jgi:hypothetical protein